MSPVYVVNLESNVDRINNFINQASRQNISIRRIHAIDGKCLTSQDLHLIRADGPWGLITANEIACFLSHREAWKAISEDTFSWGVVVEDDVHISSALSTWLTDTSWIPTDADIVKMEAYPNHKFCCLKSDISIGDRTIYRMRSTLLGAGAYLISRKICKYLVSENLQINMPVDNYLFDERSPKFKTLNSYVLEPALFIQDLFLDKHNPRFMNFDSNLSQSRQGRFYKDKLEFQAKGKSKFVREFKRVIRRLRKSVVTKLYFNIKNGVKWNDNEFL